MSGTFVVLLCCLAAFASAVPQYQGNVHLSGNVHLPEFCLLPPVDNNATACNDFSVRFYYDARTRDCETMVYSGCGGTQNLFVSERECEVQCEDFGDYSQESLEHFDD